MTEPLLRAQDVVVKFKVGRRELTAVDHVSLDVGRGETVGLVGESGSGKTTFGLAVMRAHDLDEGRIVFDGTDLSGLDDRRLRPFRRRMQMVFQDPFASLDPKMKVGAIVSEPMRVHHTGTSEEIQERVATLLEAVGLPSNSVGRYPSQFSGGQKQRISIARALALDPEFLVADEPVSALDVSIQAQVIAVLEEVRQRFGLTSLVIAHDLALVYQITDRIAVMYLGQIVEEGPTDQVVFGPLHPYTASLLSASPVADPELERSRQRIVLLGDPPSPIEPPAACRFHTRCPIARPVCSTETPPLVEVATGRRVACHFAGEVGPVLEVD
ncbi:MAG: ABC transporter ATP-binding protein [Acidimicrobiia bacterium]|nr:ABC transporter ATP-binding protein [Acidimicrobiia bacterium]